MIGKLITKELINGVMEVVEILTYSNGKTVKRVLDKTTGVPKEIISAE